MAVLDAENLFKKGLIALVDGAPERAVGLFESAVRVEKQRGANRPQMRYLSYYGLAMAMAHGPTPEVIQACRTAAERDFFSPELQLNLGKVYAMAGRATPALEAFERGLKLAPGNRVLWAEKRKLDRRKSPVIASLPRNHGVNRVLGRLRARARRLLPERAPAVAS